MFNIILNYTIRGLIIVVGAAMAFNLIDAPEHIKGYTTAFGIFAMAFGIYRVVMFYSQNKRYQSFIDNRDKEEGR
jgi:hypothetical protein